MANIDSIEGVGASYADKLKAAWDFHDGSTAGKGRFAKGSRSNCQENGDQ
jgi:hypothetical protein